MAGAAAAAPRVLHKYTHTTFAVEFPQLTHVKAMKITSPHSPTAADMKRRVCGELLGGKTLATHGLSVEAMAQDAVLKMHVRNDVTGTTTYRDCSDNETLEGFMLQLIFRSRETTARFREACNAFANAKHEVRSEAARQAAIHVVAKKEEPKSTKSGRKKRKRVDCWDVYRENVGRATILLLGYVQARRDSAAGLALPPESAMLANLPEQAMREILRTIVTPLERAVASIQYDVTAENNEHSAAGNVDVESIRRSVSATLRVHGKDGFVRIQAVDYGEYVDGFEESRVLVKCICPQPAATASVAAVATEIASEDESSLWEHLLQIEYLETEEYGMEFGVGATLKVFENPTLLERMRSQLALDELLTLEKTFAVTVLSLLYPDQVKGGRSRRPSWNLARCAFYPDENANDSPRFASSMIPRNHRARNSEPEVVATPFHEW